MDIVGLLFLLAALLLSEWLIIDGNNAKKASKEAFTQLKEQIAANGSTADDDSLADSVDVGQSADGSQTGEEGSCMTVRCMRVNKRQAAEKRVLEGHINEIF